MREFFHHFDKAVSSPLFDKMIKFTRPLYDTLGVNHFWYLRITRSGYYSYVGTHVKWSEYCLREALLNRFACLRHPDTFRHEIGLMKANGDSKYDELLQIAWNKFHINFNLNLFNKTSEGIEAFGFATRFDDPKSDERLINELPLLRSFTQTFRKEHQKLLDLIKENQVNIADHVGSIFFERPKEIILPIDRSQLINTLSNKELLSLTRREREILKFLALGFPASHIGKQLHLGTRTIENYTAAIKHKLLCRSKVELISKAQEFRDIL